MRELSSEQNMSSERRVLGKSRQVEAVEPFRERKVLAYKGLESLPQLNKWAKDRKKKMSP